MREIKFRAWNGAKIITNIHKHSDFNFHCMGDYRGFALEQYTGLKDKNGDEIYEGDILRAHGVVLWNGTQHAWSSVTEYKTIREHWHDLDYLTSEFEVVGNIHENKELLI